MLKASTLRFIRSKELPLKPQTRPHTSGKRAANLPITEGRLSHRNGELHLQSLKLAHTETPAYCQSLTPWEALPWRRGDISHACRQKTAAFPESMSPLSPDWWTMTQIQTHFLKVWTFLTGSSCWWTRWNGAPWSKRNKLLRARRCSWLTTPRRRSFLLVHSRWPKGVFSTGAREEQWCYRTDPHFIWQTDTKTSVFLPQNVAFFPRIQFFFRSMQQSFISSGVWTPENVLQMSWKTNTSAAPYLNIWWSCFLHLRDELMRRFWSPRNLLKLCSDRV